jgi:hypothetical protein
MCNLCIGISCFIGVIDDDLPPLVASEDMRDDGMFWALQNMLQSMKLLTVLVVGVMNVTVRSLLLLLSLSSFFLFYFIIIIQETQISIHSLEAG